MKVYNWAMAWWQQPFFQVALPVIVAFFLANWSQSKALDGINKRIDDLRDSINRRIDNLERGIGQRLDSIDQRLGRIENLLMDHDRRITSLEERTSPIRR